MVQEQALLAGFGRRLRDAREQADLSVSELARRTGLSRRHVTEAEAGRANPTLVTLARLARALRLSIGDLTDLPQGSLRGERIALVGLRGAGKSTIGRHLALALEVPFVELDQRVEARAGMPLAEIFDLRGMQTFRRLERESLEEVLAEGQRQVIATGGSIVDEEATFARLRESCRTLWLSATPSDHMQRVLDQGDRRPVQGHPEAMAELEATLRRRNPLYGACEGRIETSGMTADEVLERSVAWVQGAGRAEFEKFPH
jgi:XRE family transcriptional regulator, aerobic/anaerobic benzoate catabolism transcriptional regulator